MNVFISYAQEDTQRIVPICQALTSWQVSFWAPPRTDVNTEQNAQIQQSLTQTDILLRICSPATPRSYWMTFEQTAFLSLQAAQYRQQQQVAQKLINLILDASYQREPFDYADPIIDATSLNDNTWQTALHAAIFSSVTH